MQIGAQLYTVRAYTQTPDSFAETLKKVAEIGYKTVQVSGTCAFEPEWLKNELAKNGLQCVITHTPPVKMLADPVQVAKDHDVFDCKYIGLGSYDFSQGGVAAFTRAYQPVTKAFCENGKYFMYHNHYAEFKKENGVYIMDQIANAFTPEELGFTVDTYWVQYGGFDPVEWIEKLHGRVPCIHLKDYAFDAKMAVVGEGNLNFDRIVAAAEKSGCSYLLVEQDDCYGEDPMGCLARSYQNLTAMGLR